MANFLSIEVGMAGRKTPCQSGLTASCQDLSATFHRGPDVYWRQRMARCGLPGIHDGGRFPMRRPFASRLALTGLCLGLLACGDPEEGLAPPPVGPELEREAWIDQPSLVSGDGSQDFVP